MKLIPFAILLSFSISIFSCCDEDEPLCGPSIAGVYIGTNICGGTGLPFEDTLTVQILKDQVTISRQGGLSYNLEGSDCDFTYDNVFMNIGERGTVRFEGERIIFVNEIIGGFVGFLQCEFSGAKR